MPHDQDVPERSPLWQPLVLAIILGLFCARRTWKFFEGLVQYPKNSKFWLAIDAVMAVLFLGGTVIVVWLAFRERRGK